MYLIDYFYICVILTTRISSAFLSANVVAIVLDFGTCSFVAVF